LISDGLPAASRRRRSAILVLIIDIIHLKSDFGADRIRSPKDRKAMIEGQKFLKCGFCRMGWQQSMQEIDTTGTAIIVMLLP
jgi:hypothetical protein